MMMMASNTRSITSDANAAVKGTRGVSRASAYARATSPARAGTVLLIIMPMAMARQSMPNGNAGASGSRM
jgi:hypothetical protein